MSANEYLSLAEAEKITGVSQDYFRICIRKGYLQGEKFGRNWLLKRNGSMRILAPIAPN